MFYENINDIAAGYRYPNDIAITEEILFQPSLALYWAELNKRKNFYARSILGYLGYRYILHGGRTERQKAMGKLAGHRQVAFEAGALYSRNLNTIIDMCRRGGNENHSGDIYRRQRPEKFRKDQNPERHLTPGGPIARGSADRS